MRRVDVSDLAVGAFVMAKPSPDLVLPEPSMTRTERQKEQFRRKIYADETVPFNIDMFPLPEFHFPSKKPTKKPPVKFAKGRTMPNLKKALEIPPRRLLQSRTPPPLGRMNGRRKSTATISIQRDWKVGTSDTRLQRRHQRERTKKRETSCQEEPYVPPFIPPFSLTDVFFESLTPAKATKEKLDLDEYWIKHDRDQLRGSMSSRAEEMKNPSPLFVRSPPVTAAVPSTLSSSSLSPSRQVLERIVKENEDSILLPKRDSSAARRGKYAFGRKKLPIDKLASSISPSVSTRSLELARKGVEEGQAKACRKFRTLDYLQTESDHSDLISSKIVVDLDTFVGQIHEIDEDSGLVDICIWFYHNEFIFDRPHVRVSCHNIVRILPKAEFLKKYGHSFLQMFSDVRVAEVLQEATQTRRIMRSYREKKNEDRWKKLSIEKAKIARKSVQKG